MLHFMFLRSKVSLFKNHSTITKTKKLTQLIYRPYSDFTTYLNNVLSREENLNHELHSIVMSLYLISFNLEQFISFSLSFITLTFLRSAQQLFCRMSLSLGLSDVSSWVDSGYAFLAEISQNWCVFLSASYQEAKNVSFPLLMLLTMIILIISLRWCLPVFSTMKL